MSNEYKYFYESNISNARDNAKRYKAPRYNLPKCIIKKYNIIINDSSSN